MNKEDKCPNTLRSATSEKAEEDRMILDMLDRVQADAYRRSQSTEGRYECEPATVRERR